MITAEQARLSNNRRKAIRKAKPDTAVGRVWQKNAIEAVEALETAERERDLLQAQLDQVRALAVQPTHDRHAAELNGAIADCAGCVAHHLLAILDGGGS